MIKYEIVPAAALQQDMGNRKFTSNNYDEAVEKAKFLAKERYGTEYYIVEVKAKVGLDIPKELNYKVTENNNNES